MSNTPAGLGSRIAKATFWTVGMRWAMRMLGVISVIILARILVPEDYGIVAQAVMVYSFLELMTALGLENALIRDRTAGRRHYDTVWTLHILRGVSIAVVLCLLAIPAASFFNQPELTAIIIAYAGISVIQGFLNVGTVDFRKELRFDLDFKFNVCRRLSGFLVTITVAYYFRTYWAFLAGTATSALVGVALSFIMSRYRPKLSLVEWRSLFDFSKWVLGYQLIASLSGKLDTFILSRMAGSQQLGLYTVSMEVAGAASTEIAMPISRAVLPGLSMVNEDRQRFRDLYVSALSIVLAIAVPAALGISALSELATNVLLGDKWTDAAPIIFLLSFYGIGRVIVAVSTSAYISFGRVDMMTKLAIINLCMATLCVGGGYYLAGFWGLIWGMLLKTATNSIISLLVQTKIGQLDLPALLRNMWRVVTAGIVMWLTLRQYTITTGLGSLADLAISVGLGATVYVGVTGFLCALVRPEAGPEREILGYILPRISPRLAERVGPAATSTNPLHPREESE